MQVQNVKKARLKLAKKLIGCALNGYYYFDDDTVEAFIDKLDLKFQKRSDCNQIIKSSLISHPKLYPIVADAAWNMWGQLP